jgi:hypothetical protein
MCDGSRVMRGKEAHSGKERRLLGTREEGNGGKSALAERIQSTNHARKPPTPALALE